MGERRNVGMRMHRCCIFELNLGPYITADKTLRVASVDDNLLVVGDHYYPRQLGIFIPEGAIVPDKLAEEMWVKGKLGGSKKNRVKVRDVRGHESSGLFYGSQGASWNPAWRVGDNVTEEIGVTFG